MAASFEVHDVRPQSAAAAKAMTVSHRRLAGGLWPWLLMAALQVVFGQTGLELAVAVESERATPRAVIKVTLMKHDPPGKAITLEGVFVGGSAGYADGKLLQVGVPRTSPDERVNHGFHMRARLSSIHPSFLFFSFIKYRKQRPELFSGDADVLMFRFHMFSKTESGLHGTNSLVKRMILEPH